MTLLRAFVILSEGVTLLRAFVILSEGVTLLRAFVILSEGVTLLRRAGVEGRVTLCNSNVKLRRVLRLRRPLGGRLRSG